MPYTILRLPAVVHRTGISSSLIYDLMSRGEFPRPIRLGKRAVGWQSNDLETWLETRPRGGCFVRGSTE